MTVRELMVHLATLPPGAAVAYTAGSDYHSLLAEDIVLKRAADEVMVRHHNMAGIFRTYRKREWLPEGPSPEFVDTVIFPGN